MKRMMTKKKGIADHEAEAKALELKDQDIYVPEIKQKQETKSTEQKEESKMRRQSTLKSGGNEAKTAAAVGVTKTSPTPAAKAVVVGKQESGCCTIF